MDWLAVVLVFVLVGALHVVMRRAGRRAAPRREAGTVERRRYVARVGLLVVLLAAAALLLASDNGRPGVHALVYVGVFVTFCAWMLALVWRRGRES
jgi:hypothetical protein